MVAAGITQQLGSSAALDNESRALGANEAFPYSGLNGPFSVASVVSQAALGPNSSTQVALAALQDALANNVGPIDVIAYSGGARAFATALGQLSPADQARIGNVLYISPGMGGGTLPPPNGVANTTVVMGSGVDDALATIGTTIPIGVRTIYTQCDHGDLACLLENSPLAQITADGSCDTFGVYDLQNMPRRGGAGAFSTGIGMPTGGGPGWVMYWYWLWSFRSQPGNIPPIERVTSTIRWIAPY